MSGEAKWAPAIETAAGKVLAYCHQEFCGQAPETWLHYERDPSDGSPAPIEFEFFWVEYPDGVPELSGGQGTFLPRLPVPGPA